MSNPAIIQPEVTPNSEHQPGYRVGGEGEGNFVCECSCGWRAGVATVDPGVAADVCVVHVRDSLRDQFRNVQNGEIVVSATADHVHLRNVAALRYAASKGFSPSLSMQGAYGAHEVEKTVLAWLNARVWGMGAFRWQGRYLVYLAG